MKSNKSDTCPALALQPKGGHHATGNRGFTLVELIVVSAILGVLILIAIPAYSKLKDLAREVRAMEEIRGIEKAINSYYIDKGSLPPDLASLQTSIPVDPWGNAYQYQRSSDGSPRLGMFDAMTPLNDDYDLYSKGADGKSVASIEDPVSLDDIIRSGDGGFVGMANALTP